MSGAETAGDERRDGGPDRAVLVTLTGDGTFALPSAGAGVPMGGPSPAGAGESAASDAPLTALERVRSLLGDDLEEQIATRPYLPAALGTDATDHLLPASLALLADTSGDLASFGWRVGAGGSLAWNQARDRRERMIDAARIAFFGYEGDLVVTALGPLTLAGSTYVSSGERTLADRGALRDLPVLLAEGIAEHARQLRERVPGAVPRVLLREDGADAVLEGRIPTPSGYRRYPALPAEEFAPLWRSLLVCLEEQGVPADQVTLAPGDRLGLLRAAHSAGAGELAVSPAALGDLRSASGREAWELVASAREQGTAVQLVLDPGRVDRTLGSVAEIWGRLGFAPRELRGFTLAVTTAARGDDGIRTGLLREAALTGLLREAPAWAARLSD